MRWAIEIRCTQLERRNLADLLAPLGLVLIEESPHVAFTSDKINHCMSAAEAYAIAKGVREAFVGPANIDATFALGSVIDYSQDPPARHIF